MDKSPLPLSSSSKFSFQSADLNSNQILSSDTQKEEKLTSQEYQHYSASSPNHNKCLFREKPLILNSPTTTFTTSLHQKDLSYDDLSKNIDANLAEIDMETFRSEDINSILALPAIYSGHFDSVSHGEQCASVSGSLLNGLEIETSVSNRISEDEISICKDEPLFSPQRDPPTHERTISVDSLDNSSSYDQDLVLTCKANKNNYTIVFEGSETQFSEDSEYHNALRSSEVVSSASEDINNENSYASNSMIQSDLVFTTWSNLKRTHVGKSRKKFLHDIAIKSKSLPNLSYQSAFFNDKVLQWAKSRGNKNSLFPDLDLYHPSGLQVIRKCGYPYTLSLVKLFMKYKVSSRSSVFSSEHSSSTNSLIVHSLNNINHSSPISSSKTDTKEYKECDADLANQNYNIKNQISLENLNTNQKRQLFVDNIRILDWHPEQDVIESNNNTESLKSFPTTGNKVHNTSNLKDGSVVTPVGECDNSQYFEDSLMEAPILQVKNFNAMPIKEEEETDISSGDEIMKTSMSSDCNNCSSASIDAAMIKNNTLDVVSNVTRQDVEHNLERIINIFPSCKTNVTAAAVQTLNDGLTQNKDLLQDNQTQGTQTKQYNSKNCINIDTVQLPCSDPQKITSRQVPNEHCVRHSSGSRDTSPNSSGYVSSRHSSVERQQRSSAGSSVDIVTRTGLVTKMKNVLLTTTRSCSTQVPVHVKDVAMQTSTLASSNSDIGFLLRSSSKEDISETEYVMEQNIKPDQESNGTSNKPLAKEDKCIYVCFPNYSLPDLSFLRSVSSEGSGSVFLSPTKFKPPQKAVHAHTSRPKSSDGLDSRSRKRLSNIKDWESLSVLLPDDLKHLLSQMHLKEGKSESSSARHGLSESKSFPSSKVDKTECLDSDGKKPTSSFFRQCSFNMHNRNHLSNCHSSASFKELKPEETKVKTQPSEVCSCQQCILDTNVSFNAHSKGACKLPTSQNYLGKNVSCRNVYKEPVFSSLKHQNYSAQTQKPEQIHSCSRHVFQKHFIPVLSQDELKVTSSHGFEEKSGMCHENTKLQHPTELTVSNVQHEHSPYSALKTLRKCKNATMISSSGNIRRNVESALCQNPTCCDAELKPEKKDPTVELGHPIMRSGKAQRLKDCDSVNSDFFEMEKAPQEFLVSPVQMSSPYPVPPDSYQVQTSLGGGSTVFHESLKRKTGLVENLQKATSLIYEDHSKSLKHGASCCTSFSVGQKILTSLCPALHTILSDGLLPSVQGFFGPLPNSPWKVTEACVQLEESKKEVQELLKHVNSEKLLTDSTYRFNAFIMGLLNLGCLEWWLGHLLSTRSLISHHYHPTALLSLLALPASSHLQQELMELVSPLTNLPFNLDLAFETRIAAAKVHEKCNSNCCSSSKNQLPDDLIQTKLSNFAFCHSHVDQEKCSKMDPKYNADILGLSNTGCKAESQDQPVWPGITINPFPNIQMPKDSDRIDVFKHVDPKLPESLKYECTQKVYSGLKEKRCKKRITDFSLCSSTDSGCSSQVCHSHVISSVATDSGELENPVSAKEDGHQFRKLQQKWEKITLGMDKHQQQKNAATVSPPPTQNNCNNSKKPVEVSVKKTSKCQLRVAANCDISRNTKAMTIKRAVSQPPSSKPHSKLHPEVSYERKLQTPDVIASSKASSERKNRSQIPTLKSAKSLQPKSKIPIQKSGVRTQSANRDSRNLS